MMGTRLTVVEDNKHKPAPAKGGEDKSIANDHKFHTNTNEDESGGDTDKDKGANNKDGHKPPTVNDHKPFLPTTSKTRALPLRMGTSLPPGDIIGFVALRSCNLYMALINI